MQLEALSLVLRHTCVGHGQVSNGLSLLAKVGLKQRSEIAAVNVSPPNIMDTLKIQPNTVVVRLKKSIFLAKTKMAIISIFGKHFQNVLSI